MVNEFLASRHFEILMIYYYELRHAADGILATRFYIEKTIFSYLCCILSSKNRNTREIFLLYFGSWWQPIVLP
jgi:hypothetical protein